MELTILDKRDKVSYKNRSWLLSCLNWDFLKGLSNIITTISMLTNKSIAHLLVAISLKPDKVNQVSLRKLAQRKTIVNNQKSWNVELRGDQEVTITRPGDHNLGSPSTVPMGANVSAYTFLFFAKSLIPPTTEKKWNGVGLLQHYLCSQGYLWNKILL